jgi:hypothetical protein
VCQVVNSKILVEEKMETTGILTPLFTSAEVEGLRMVNNQGKTKEGDY